MLVLHQGADWFFNPTPKRGSSGVLIGDGKPMESERGNWWKTDASPDVIEWETTFSVATGYQLREGIEPSTQFGPTMTVEDWTALSEDAPERALYEAIREQRTRREVDDSARVQLEGSPAPDDGLSWVAELPFEIRNHTEFLHLFPGRLFGFPEALAEQLSALPGVSAYPKTPFSCYARIPDPRPPKSRRKADRRGVLTVEVKFSRPVPQVIAGDDRASATDVWNKTLLEFIAEIDTVGAVLCEHCEGSGYIQRGTKRSK